MRHGFNFSKLVLLLTQIFTHSNASSSQLLHYQGRSGSRGAIGAIAPPKTYESNFIHHDLIQFRKKHLRNRAILPSIVLSQQCCEVKYTSCRLQ